jgi:hypothetical protein
MIEVFLIYTSEGAFLRCFSHESQFSLKSSSTFDNGQYQHFKECSKECLAATAACFETDGDRFGHTLLLRGVHDLDVDQAVSRQLSTSVGQVRPQVKSCGICDGQSGSGAGFHRIFGFPLPIIPGIIPHSSSSIIRDWCNMSNIGRRTRWTQSHPTASK